MRSHGAWDAFVDEETREEYYYNRETDETTWEPPIPEIMPPHLAALEFLSKLMSNPYDPEQPHPLSSFGLWSVYVDHESMSMYYVSVPYPPMLQEVKRKNLLGRLPRHSATTRLGRHPGIRLRTGMRSWPASHPSPS